MYFSLIMSTPGHEREAAHNRVQGPYEEHQWLWRFFPSAPDVARDFLFRYQEIEGLPRYYLVSHRLPQSTASGWSVQTREYAPQLEEGMRFHFDLRANPVVTTKRDGKARRDDVVMAEKKRLLAVRSLTHWKDWSDAEKPDIYTLVDRTCRAWLAARSERCGFAIDEQALAADGYQNHIEKRQLQRERQLCFSTVNFSGVLTVTDRELFQQALFAGIGPAKAFGCGLLLVRRL